MNNFKRRRHVSVAEARSNTPNREVARVTQRLPGTASPAPRRPPGRGLDPFTSGRRSFERGEPLNADFGSNCSGWPPISAQCLYELGRLKSASLAAQAARKRGKEESKPAASKRKRGGAAAVRP